MPGHRLPKELFKNHQLYSKYSCLSCKCLLRNAVQSALCGHWFCQSCISQLLKTRDPVCPNCSENLKSDEDAEGSPGYFPDKFVRRDIDALEMVCPYKSDGCTWEGTFRKLEGHLASCEYSVCRHCHQRLTTVPSEHMCTLTTWEQGYLRGNGEDFRCPLTRVGCTAGTFETKDELEVHMKDSEIAHNELLAAIIANLETTGRTQESITVKPCQCTDIRNGAFESSQFSAPKPAKRADGMKQEVDSVRRELRNKDEMIASLKTVISKLERNQRSKNTEFEDRDFRLSLIENSKYDGTMVWKIPQFSQRMTDAQSGKYTSIFSLPFYSGHYGYKMCLRLYILGDGIGKGGYMSLFFVLMKGEFDNILQWPFTHKVTFKLLNQGNGRDIVDTFQPDPMSTSFRKPKSDMNIVSGCPRFVSHEDLRSGGFIVDDTVFMKCIVSLPHNE